MSNQWIVKKTGNVANNFGLEKYDPIILQILSARGIMTEQEVERFFNFNYEKDILEPFLFADMPKAVARIIEAKNKKEKVAIFGDYDADGVTAAAVLFEALSKLGFEDVDIYIPDRQAEGYGMNPEAVEYLYRRGVKLIITVDCGITNVAEVDKARELGMEVVITDHHHIPEMLPAAAALINPHLKNCGYPFEDLCGVGVAFKLAAALYQKLDPQNAEQLKWSLDLVAIGTIADCVPLLGENRLLVKYGLLVLSKTKRIGLQEMFKVGRIAIDENSIPSTQKVAFQIAPRINASGRMDHASLSYELITASNRVTARDIALEVEEKNQQRQKITAEIAREVRVLAENSYKDKKLIFAHNENWPVGILGLIAGRIADEFQKPTIVLQKQAREYVGSLRSVPEVNIVEALGGCEDLVIKFGGHSQAAGVRVAEENIEKFYEKLSGLVEAKLEGKEILPKIEIDLELEARDINWELAAQIKKMEPFGEGNEEPIFLLKNMIVDDLRIVGNGSKHLKLALRDGGGSPKIFGAIGFGMGEKFPNLKIGDKIQIVCNVQEDEWNGNKKIQLNLIDLRLAE